jgi:hypothetical protein
MIFQKTGAKKRPGRAAGRSIGPARKVYSVPVWPVERAFRGSFELGGSSYKLLFAPSRAEGSSKKLELQGRLTVTDPRGRSRTIDSVRATLASIQGGLGTPPARRQVIAAGAQTGNISTPQQKQQAAGENEKRSGQQSEDEAKRRGARLPETEYTGNGSFTGVMYFHFEPLNGGALGVAADLNRVQLNARLVTRDETAGMLHGLYSTIVDALYGESVDEAMGAAAINELNRVLAG